MIKRLDINEDILIDCFKAGLRIEEIQTIFNCSSGALWRIIHKHSLKRQKPKADYSDRFGHTKRHAQISKKKGTLLRKCRNPNCDNYYYGRKGRKYCCPECEYEANGEVRRLRVRRWRFLNFAYCKRSTEYFGIFWNRIEMEV